MFQRLNVKLPAPLTWEDILPALEMIDSVEELEAAVRNPEAFVKRLFTAAVAPALLKAAIHVAVPMLKERVEASIPPPLTWEDVEPAVRAIDTVQEVQAAIENPQAFITLRH